MVQKLSDLIQLGSGSGLTLETEKAAAFTAAANTVYPVRGGVTATLDSAIAEGAWVILLDESAEWAATAVIVAAEGEAFDGTLGNLELTGDAIGAAFYRTATGWDAYVHESATPYFEKLRANFGLTMAVGDLSPALTRRASASIETATATGNVQSSVNRSASMATAAEMAIGSPAGKRATFESVGVTTVFAMPAINQLAYRAESQAIFDNFTATPSTTRLDKIDDCVDGLIVDGIWSLLDRLWIMWCHESGYGSRMDWKSPGTSARALTAVNSPTFVIDQGFKGDGISKRLMTGYNASTDGVNYTQNSACAGAWVRTLPTTGGIMGVRQLSSDIGVTEIYMASGDWSFCGANTSHPATNWLSEVDGTTGLITVNRLNSSDNELYQSGTLVDTQSEPSAEVINEEWAILALAQKSNTPSFHSSAEVSAAFIGAGLNSTKQSALNSRLSTLFA